MISLINADKALKQLYLAMVEEALNRVEKQPKEIENKEKKKLDLDICRYHCNLYEPDTNACSGNDQICPQMGPSYLCGECSPWLSDADPAEYVDSYCKSRECPLVTNEFEKPF